jgi:probable lipoprotein NlpC
VGRTSPDLSFYDLQARLAARAASLVGQAGEFRVAGARFNRDCTGFVQAVYEAEGIPLRALMQRAAPNERSGVVAAFRAMQENGTIFGGGGEWPAPGDLVFWHDTYDRNRNGRADDGFTHVGVVEYVADDGTVVFVHRGKKAVARGAMNPERPREAKANGYVVNSPIRSRNPRLEGVPVLAGALFAGYARIDPARLPLPPMAIASRRAEDAPPLPTLSPGGGEGRVRGPRL